jgi:2'-phosphotransferase
MIPASALDKAPSSESSEAQGELESEALQSISESDNPADFLIRANQGHSIQVDVEGLLTPITMDAGNVPETVVHGTDEPAWRLILKSGGLRRMGRNHIHFASGLPAGFKSLAIDTASTEEREAAPVISGMRKNSSVLIYIDIQAALAAGVKFYLSENGVILTEGNDKGFLSYEFFKRVESRKQGGGVLMSDGKLPEGVVVDVDEWEKEVGDAGKGRKSGRGGGRGGRGGGRGGKARANDDSRDVLADV